MKKRTYCDSCPHAYTEFCYGCAYANDRGCPNVSDWDPDDFDEDECESNEE